MAQIADSLIIDIRATFEKLASDVNGAAKTLSGFEKRFSIIGKGLGAAMSAGAALGFAAFVKTATTGFVEIGDRAGDVAEAFKNLGGSSAAIGEAEKATMGLVSATNLMEAANKGLLKGIPELNKNFADIAGLATIEGIQQRYQELRIMGESNQIARERIANELLMNRNTNYTNTSMNLQTTDASKRNTERTSKQLQGSLNTTDKKNYLVEFEEIEGTPFTAVKEMDNWFIVMGKYRLSEPFESKENAIKWSEIIDWNKITTVMTILLKEQENLKNL